MGGAGSSCPDSPRNEYTAPECSNPHLKPVFSVLLPELEKDKIEYWVYGGIAIAACAERFIRENTDVDIFVKCDAFEDTRSILQDVCDQNGFRLKKGKRLKRSARPKLEVIINGKERLSVVPVYLEEKVVRFEFSNGPARYPYQMLKKVPRNISGYRFFTPPNEYIKELFMRFLKNRPDVKKRCPVQTDAKAILTPDEFEELMGEEAR